MHGFELCSYSLLCYTSATAFQTIYKVYVSHYVSLAWVMTVHSVHVYVHTLPAISLRT